MTVEEILKSHIRRYEKEYKTKGPQVVTSEIDEGGDTIYRRLRMTDKERMICDGYNEHNRKTYESYVETIRPKRFYSETEVMTFVKYIRRIAGRTVTDDEMMLLLRTITKGRQYRLTCLVDRTKELEGVTKWVRVK